MSDSRRAFLLKIARGAAYSAPVVVTLAAPEGLLGQGQNTNSQKGGMGKGMPCPPGQGQMDACATIPTLPVQPGEAAPGPSAPWEVRPRTKPPPGGSAPSAPRGR